MSVNYQFILLSLVCILYHLVVAVLLYKPRYYTEQHTHEAQWQVWFAWWVCLYGFVYVPFIARSDTRQISQDQTAILV